MRWLLALPVVAGVLLAAPAFAQEIEALRLSRHPDHTRMVIDFSAVPRYRLHELPDPPRLVIDVANSSPPAVLEQLDLRGTPIVGIRSSVQDDGDLRLVLEFGAAAVQVSSFVLKPYLARGHRLVVDLYPTDNAASMPGQAIAKPGSGVESGLVPAGADDSPVADAGSEPPAVQAVNQAAGLYTAGAAALADDAEATSISAQVGEDYEAAPEPQWDIAFSGTWEQEWGADTEDGDAQKFEAVIEPRLDIGLSDGMSLTTIFRLRLDSVGDIGPEKSRPDNYSNINGPFLNNARREFSLREMYLDGQWGETYWRLGKQQVVWGQADGIKVLDVVNPQSFREFIVDDFDDSRIPLTMMNVEIPVAGESTLQLLWIPDTTYHELAEPGTTWFLTSPTLVPQAPPGLEVRIESFDKPDDPFRDSDAGARFSAFVGGWDVTLNYLYHYQDFPVLYQSLRPTADGGAQGVVSPGYERNHLVGGTLSNVLFGNLTLRAELAHNSDTYHVSSDLARRGIAASSEFSGVIGLDWQPGSDAFISAQYFQSSLQDYVSSIARDKTERNVSLVLQQSFLNENLQFNGLLLYSVNNEDTWAQLKLKYVLQSNLELWIGADLFNGDRDGLFGQFTDNDRALIGMKLGF